MLHLKVPYGAKFDKNCLKFYQVIVLVGNVFEEKCKWNDYIVDVNKV